MVLTQKYLDITTGFLLLRRILRNNQFRVSAGFSLNPPFKGFGMAFLWFAVDEPQLFSLIMGASMPTGTFKGYIDTFVGL